MAAVESPPTSDPGSDPRTSLPAHTRQLLWFGERPDWNHDGSRFLFLNAVFGDVYEYELSSGRITAVTSHFRHHGFTRALYLKNGDILLSGPVQHFDRTDPEARERARKTSQLSVLGRDRVRAPVPLGIECQEGPAVSRSRLRIAWTHSNQSRIAVGEIAYIDGRPELVGRREVLSVEDFPEGGRPKRWIETQNFVPPADEMLTLVGYELEGGTDTESYTFDLRTRELRNISRAPDRYDEAEGISPDGAWTTVESGLSRGESWPLIDIHRLLLDGSGKRERLTHFTDFPGWKANQSVVSDDGRTMLFCLGCRGTEAGQGFGIFLLDLTRFPAKPE